MPSKVGSKGKMELKDRYVGETKHQLRHGYGVYRYDNKFFRYEGQWENGLKHGHGKLVLGDGGYYEGKFDRGEIQGHGYRVFGLSGTTYSGQFHQGQIHGQGLMRKTSGELYEGSWEYGKKQGEGIFTDAQGGVYEGSFHDNKRHGEGRQIYSNGDQYEGEWVLDKRHGQGLQRCSDGTIYDGQWRGDVYHGEGSISHASGVTYTGLWVNGRPACEAAKLVAVCESATGLSVDQGKSFSLNFQCVDANGELTTLESGRSFRVTAAIKKACPSPRMPKKRVKPPLVPSPSKERIPVITTPFGYTAMSYNLLQVPSTPSTNENPPSKESDVEKAPTTDQVSEQQSSELAVADSDLITTSSTQLELKSVTRPTSRSRSESLHPSLLAHQDTRSLLMGRKLDNATSEETKAQKKDEEFLNTLIPPYTVSMTSGKAMFQDLYLPPPPLPDISHIVTPTLPSTIDLREIAEERSRPDSRLQESPTPQITSQASKGGGWGVASSVAKMKKGSEKIKAEKERLLNPKREKHAIPGTYVLIVSEVTDPPFLGTSLPDLFVELKVLPVKTKEPSMDKVVRTKSRVKTIGSRMSNLSVT